VVFVTPEPGVSLFERLRESAESLGLLQHALEQIAEKDEQRAQLSKAAAARAGQLVEALRRDVGLLPRGRGRPLEEIPLNFLQEIRRLRDEEGWGRPRIVAAMRDHGVSEWKVRRILERDAGEKSSSKRG
jgi:hypothetical protein